MNILKGMFGKKEIVLYRIYEIRTVYTLQDGKWVKSKVERIPTSMESTDIKSLRWQVPASRHEFSEDTGTFIAYRIEKT